MKKLLLSTLVLLALSVSAQDTTHTRLIVLGTFPADIYFNPDTGLGVFAPVSLDGAGSSSSGHGIFENPTDGKLYAVVDPTGAGPRSFYEVNPLTGENTMVYDAQELFASVEITDDGRIFGIHGNGGSNPGAVYEIDITNQSDSMVFQSSVPSFNPRALGFNPMTDELYVVSGFIDSIYIYEMNTWNETLASGSLGEEIHGCYYKNDSLHVVAYGGHHSVIDLQAGYNSSTWQYGRYPHAMDLCEITLIQEESGHTVCEGEYIHAKYEANSYAWYKDGEMIANSDSMAVMVTEAGTYQLVAQIRDTAAYVWSEEVEIMVNELPDVLITPAAETICDSDTVILTGTAGGMNQWYMNGMMIAGADSNVLVYTSLGNTPGTVIQFNMHKTDSNGCADSSATPAVITVDSCTGVGIESIVDGGLTVYPNPVQNELMIQSNYEIDQILVFSIDGVLVNRENTLNAKNITFNVEDLPAGQYILKLHSAETTMIRSFIKQ